MPIKSFFQISPLTRIVVFQYSHIVIIQEPEIRMEIGAVRQY